MKKYTIAMNFSNAEIIFFANIMKETWQIFIDDKKKHKCGYILHCNFDEKSWFAFFFTSETKYCDKIWRFSIEFNFFMKWILEKKLACEFIFYKKLSALLKTFQIK